MKIRSLFKAPEGKIFIAMDLGQAETWVVAFTANEPNMKDALLHGDIHRKTASFFESKPEEEITKAERQDGKLANHSLAYRTSAEQLFRVYNKSGSEKIKSLAQVKIIRDKWHDLYPRIKTWWSELEQQLSKNRTLTTVYQRRRIFYGRWGDSLFKEATAFLPQSTVADHAYGCEQKGVNTSGGIAGINIDLKLFPEFRIVHTAHDSVMLEVPDTNDCLKEAHSILLKNFKRPLMINGETFTIPVDCEVGKNWGELKKWSPE